MNSKPISILLTGLAAVVVLVPLVSLAQSDQAEDAAALTVSASVGVFTDYMWRGLKLFDGTSIQPNLQADYAVSESGVVTAAAWSHVPGEGDRHEEHFNEVDYTLSYSHEFEPVTVSVGNVWYTFPHDNTGVAEYSGEVFASLEIALPVTTTLSVFHDWEEYDAQYYELAFSREVTLPELGEGFNITPFVSFGFGSNAEEVYNDNGLEHVTFGASSTTPLGDLELTPNLNYTDGLDEATESEFWAGITLWLLLLIASAAALPPLLVSGVRRAVRCLFDPSWLTIRDASPTDSALADPPDRVIRPLSM